MRVLFLDTVHPILEERLVAAGHQCEHDTSSPYDAIIAKIGGYDGIVIRSRIPMNEALFVAGKNLKFVARSGAGLENIDLVAAATNGITVFSSPEGNRDAVGEQAIGMLLMLFNHLKRADTEVRQGIWLREENRGIELAGKTVGIIGYGVMGKALAKKLQGFDCTVIAHDKYLVDFGDQYASEVSLAGLQERADIISLHLPQSEETHHYVNDSFIAACKKPFYLVNTARGKNVQTSALVSALKSGTIRGACLDVLEYEKGSFEGLNASELPIDFQYLIQSNQVILSPHIAGWTAESYVKLSTYLADKIIKAFPV